MKKKAIVIYVLLVSGCSSRSYQEDTFKYSVDFDCVYNGIVEHRKILSSVVLKEKDIKNLLSTLEESFEYTPGSCIQN